MSFPWESIEGLFFVYLSSVGFAIRPLGIRGFVIPFYALIRSEMEYTLLLRCVEVIISAKNPVENN